MKFQRAFYICLQLISAKKILFPTSHASEKLIQMSCIPINAQAYSLQPIWQPNLEGLFPKSQIVLILSQNISLPHLVISTSSIASELRNSIPKFTPYFYLPRYIPIKTGSIS